MAQENIKLSPEIEQLSEKLTADPKSRVFAQLADAYRKSGLLDEAIDTAKKGLENHPNYAIAHLILGRCYLAKGMYALAREEFELTIKNDPQNLVGYKLLGETYEKQNMYPEALKYYQMILDLEPADAELAEKVANLKNLKQTEPEVQAATATTGPEPAALPEEPAGEAVPEPAPEADIPAMPEILKSEEELPRMEIQAESVPMPPILTEEPVSAPIESIPIPETLSEGPKQEISEEPPAPPAEAVAAPVETTEEKEPNLSEAESQGPTSTLAEIYVQQGFLEKAIDIYKELISAQPGNQEYKDRMDELLEKAYPEEPPAAAETKELATEAVAEKPAPAPAEAEMPAPAEEPKPEVSPAADPFAQLFGSPDKKEEPTAEPEPAETPAPAAEETSPAPAAAYPEEPKMSVPPADVSPAVDFGALFNDAGEPPAKPQEPEPVKPAAEPTTPAPEAKAAEKAGDADDTVSSFQSWLSQIQK